MKDNDGRRKNINEYGDILSVKDIEEYLCVSAADAEKIITDPKLKKINIPIKKILVKKQDFIDYLSA